MGTIIKNIAFLDLTEASEDTLKEIKAIKKVAFMVYNKKFEPFMAKISFHEIASSAKVSGKFSLINGKLELDDSFVSSMKEPMFFLVNGKMIVKPDVNADMIDQAISGLLINGKIYCPESVQAALQQKVEQNNGKMVAYMDNALLETGEVTIDNDYLRQLKSKTNLAVAGEVNMIEDLDLSLFDEKLDQIQFLNGAVVLEDYLEVLSPKLVKTSSKIITVPKGFTYIGEDIHLDASEIARYEHAKLFVAGSIYLDESVSKEDVKNHIDEFKTEDAIYCRTELKAGILQKCDPSVKVVAYSGTLRVVEGEHKLTQPELDYTENKITFIVNGVLEVARNVDPKVLYDKLERLDLNGVATGSSEQCGVLQTKIGVKNGVIEGNDEENEIEDTDIPEGDDSYISNVAHLKL
ncbi:hypothetical protein EV207_11579 [Scopulibacillus darangshiensis]|uniref:Uncharacterized protein n=1 Tax=Scopulibacillus darangshiensis TaxID=442528 RepID=A0A4R2P2A6_9BACL|nr:hypothetical protein [Scopulibacillus darangshiensis]TCP28843.1 hypothetical protein EV207_11579 [Scopulibacillus darangshiensis]